MKNHKTIVLSNQEIAPNYYRMRVLAPEYTKLAKQGSSLCCGFNSPINLCCADLLGSSGLVSCLLIVIRCRLKSLLS